MQLYVIIVGYDFFLLTPQDITIIFFSISVCLGLST